MKRLAYYLTAILILFSIMVMPISAQESCEGVTEITIDLGEETVLCWDRNNPVDLVANYVVILSDTALESLPDDYSNLVIFTYNDVNCGDSNCNPDNKITFDALGDYWIYVIAHDQDGMDSNLTDPIIVHVQNIDIPAPVGGCKIRRLLP